MFLDQIFVKVLETNYDEIKLLENWLIYKI